MSQQKSRKPFYKEVIGEFLAQVDGPIAIEDLLAYMLRARPSDAKNPRTAALAKIREEQGWQHIYLDAEHVLPLRLAYQNARYRIRLERENVEQAALSFQDCFHHYLPRDIENEQITLIDSQGTAIPFKVIKAPHTVTFSDDDAVEYHNPVIVLKEWFHSQKIYHKDHILVTIKDWEKGILQLEVERYSEQHPDRLAKRNQYFADAIFDLLESAQDEDIYIDVALPTVLARMPDKDGDPPDHCRVIIDNDPRMLSDRWMIRYADGGFSPFERLFAEARGQSLMPKIQNYNKENAGYIYRFRAHLMDNSSIWREVEIRGKQTLTDLDNILRKVFNHDTVDHLAGFWKLAARGGRAKIRYREVDLGTVNPWEHEEGSDTTIAELELQPGDKLKYVYDFGDWFEHALELKSISEPESGIRYPRETARNEPKYEYCDECLNQGKKTIALLICYTCTYEEQMDVLLCEACAAKHEDHYIVEILY